MVEFQIGACGKYFHRDVLRAAVAAGRIIDVAGARLGQRNEILDGLWHAGVGDQHPVDLRNQTDRFKTVERIVIDLLVEMRRHHETAVVDAGDGVTVGRRARRTLHGDQARRAGLVVEHDLLLEVVRHLVGDDAQNRIRAAAGLYWHDHLDRLAWIGLRRGQGGAAGGGNESGA